MNLEDMIIVSVDDHVIEPANLFENHLPKKYPDRAPRLIIDLTDTPSLDSMAVGTLVRAYVSCQKAGRKLVLVGLNYRVKNILQITGERIGREIVRESDSVFAQRAQFFAAFGNQAVLVRRRRVWIRCVSHAVSWRSEWSFSSLEEASPYHASLRFAPASKPDFKLASMNSSRSPSSTRCVSVRSTPVRTSLMRD